MPGTHVMQEFFLFNGKEAKSYMLCVRKGLTHRMVNLRKSFTQGNQCAPNQVGRGLSERAEPGV